MIFETRPLNSGLLCALRTLKGPPVLRSRGCAVSVTRLCKGQELFSSGLRAGFRGPLGEAPTKTGHSNSWASGGPTRAVVLGAGQPWLRS